MTFQRIARVCAKLALCLLMINFLSTTSSRADAFDMIGCTMNYVNEMGGCGSVDNCGSDQICVNEVGQCQNVAERNYHKCTEQALLNIR